ncbi:MAG: DNA repair protein RecN [Verrucomicrobia bacterium]|nr:DNA repair protein RecN [Verrucomicrobiota bacterium]MCH8528996.1 DNA repair protein RecN [Kiritimatiellia bacterium]
MLTELTVNNLALVEKVSIRFGPGLNAITGETGAGKSVLMGALNLILGARADRKALRTGEDKGSVRGVFSLQHPDKINHILEEAGLEPCEDGLLIIFRELKAEGNGRQTVNDAAVTLALLKKLGDELVDMHGPYDHQSLLDPDTQRTFVDASGTTPAAHQAYAGAWTALRETRRRQQELQGDADALEQQLDLLRYRVQELEQAALEPGEEETLREEHTLIGNAQNIIEGLSGSLLALDETEGNAFDALAAARRALETLRDIHPDAAVWLEEVEGMQTQLRELAASLRLAGDRIEADPGRLTWLDDRLSVYSRMRKKYGPTVEDALETLAESQQRLKDLEDREGLLAELAAREAKQLQDLQTAGKALRKERQAAAKDLEAKILNQLRDLGFPDARFEIAVLDAEPAPSGIDLIDYQFAPNPGEAIRSLRDIASSGEISRVMLAIKTLLADYDQIPVMVFDEIDANVGGEMGHAIGRKMAEVGDTRQVLSITHLPQVAVHGHQHLAVRKEVVDGRTFTRVTPLTGEDRVDEIARMLGGKQHASLSADHARELLANAGKG